MKRTIQQYRACNPEAMAQMSEAAIMHALTDMRSDILRMHNAIKQIYQRSPAQRYEIIDLLDRLAIDLPKETHYD